MNKDYYKYTHIDAKQKLIGKSASVHTSDSLRIQIAYKQQNPKNIVNKERIIALTVEFLQKSGYWDRDNNLLEPYTILNPEIILPKRKTKNKRIAKIDYAYIKEHYHLNSEKHLIWMKFTTNNYLGVVARSNDVNFEIPPNECNDESELHKYISSGVILHKLREEWDETYVLIFPIPNVGDYEMSDIECGIGQYLIEKNVPILDYYSHTFM